MFRSIRMLSLVDICPAPNWILVSTSITYNTQKVFWSSCLFDSLSRPDLKLGLLHRHFVQLVSSLINFRWCVQLALYTMRTWSLTVLENVNALVSRTASPDFLRKLTYLCWNHHKEIRQIDTVRAYTFGSHYFAEVDIVLAADMPLRQAHDIGESLQDKLESLPEIERAFVHLDYEVTHRPEHAYKD